MRYHLEFTKSFVKDIKKLDRYTQRLVYSWVKKNLDGIENPRTIGKALTGNLKGKWRYRIGDYRMLCVIEDDRLLIVAISIAHRRQIYKK